MSVDVDSLIDSVKKRMEGAVNALHKEFKGLRTGRASAALLDHVVVEAYGNRMPINQIGTVSAPEPRMLSVQVWDASNVKAVEKAIASAGLGLNPIADGGLVRVPMPDLSEERRRELVKVAHQYTESSKIAMRNIRRDAIEQVKKMKKDSDISEDDLHRHTEAIQKLTDQFAKEVEQACERKEKDIMEG